MVLLLLRCRPRLLQLPGASHWDKSSICDSTGAEQTAPNRRRGTEGAARKIFIPAALLLELEICCLSSRFRLISWRGEVSCISLLLCCSSGENRLACKLQNFFRMASSPSWLLGLFYLRLSPVKRPTDGERDQHRVNCAVLSPLLQCPLSPLSPALPAPAFSMVKKNTIPDG